RAGGVGNDNGISRLVHRRHQASLLDRAIFPIHRATPQRSRSSYFSIDCSLEFLEPHGAIQLSTSFELTAYRSQPTLSERYAEPGTSSVLNPHAADVFRRSVILGIVCSGMPFYIEPLREFLVRPALPEPLSRLTELAYNLLWSWEPI